MFLLIRLIFVFLHLTLLYIQLVFLNITMISPTSIFIVENCVFFVVHVLFVSMVVPKSNSKLVTRSKFSIDQLNYSASELWEVYF